MSDEVSSPGMMVILTPWYHVIAFDSHAVGQTFDSKKVLSCVYYVGVCVTHGFLVNPILKI